MTIDSAGRGIASISFIGKKRHFQALKVSLQAQEIPTLTTHDLRRTASALRHEQGWGSDVVEKALNHTIGCVRGVYNRSEYAEQRQKILQAWSDYIDGLASVRNFVV
ncbi:MULTISPECIES: hypothetical protein [Burkholderia]|uniref:hypothetical protein n=1 Tax=Burkholderia TaxID=32008 RepID=UPI001F116517|nr:MULTISPECIES: hypothetical protein [Burkholderia]